MTLKRAALVLKSLLKRKLPLNKPQLESLTLDVLELGNFPDTASHRAAVCEFIIHCTQYGDSAYLRNFVKKINTSIASPTAWYELQDLKEIIKLEEAKMAAAEQTSMEASSDTTQP